MARNRTRPPEQRIVVTGWGMVSPLGPTVDATWDACVAGRSGVRELTRWDARGLPCRIGGEVDDAWITTPAEPGGNVPATRPHRILLTAARQAAEMAGLA